MKRILLFLFLLFSFFMVSNKVLAYKEYKIGDKLVYKGEEYYVIEDSGKEKDYVTILKMDSLTIEELYKYGRDENDHLFVNEYTPNLSDLEEVVFENPDGNGAISFYTSNTCGYSYNWVVSYYSMTNRTIDGCTFDFDKSDVKRVIENWSKDKDDDLALVDNRKFRMLTLDELLNVFHFELDADVSDYKLKETEDTPSFIHNKDFWMDMSNYLYLPKGFGNDYLYDGRKEVKPVIYLKKSALGDEDIEECPNGYKYETKKITKYDDYKVGDIVKYNGYDYKVIRDSGSYNSQVYISALSDIFDKSTKVQFYTSDTCYDGTHRIGCSNNYEESNVKKVMDNWVKMELNEDDLEEVNGYKARLIKVSDLIEKFGYFYYTETALYAYRTTEDTPKWYLDCIGSYVTWIDADGQYDNDVNTLILSDWNAVNVRNVYDYSNIMPIINLKKNAVGEKSSYVFGDSVNYMGQKYYVIEDSNQNKDYVTLLMCGVIKNKLVDKCDIGGCHEEEIEKACGCIDEDNKEMIAGDIQVVNVDDTLKTISNILLLVSLVLITLGIFIIVIYYYKVKKRSRVK